MKKYLFPVLKLLGLIAIYFVIIVASNKMFYFVKMAGVSGVLTKVVSVMVNLAAAVLLIFAYLKFDKRSFADIGASFEKGWVKKLFRGTAEGAFAMLAILAVLLITGLGAIGGLNLTDFAAIVKTILMGLFYYLFFVAATEELIVRGYMYHFLKTRYTAAGAVLVTSLIFAVMHVLNNGITALAFFNLFLTGLLMNLLVMRDKTIWSAVGFHFAWNFIMGAVFSSPVSGGASGGVIKYSLKGYELLTGGNFGVEGGLVCTLVLVLLGTNIGYKNLLIERFSEGLKRSKNA